VYLAHDVQHDRPVALKVVLPELAASMGNERFQREIRLAARLQHPHILSVYDSGEAAGQLWYTMPFVEGESLRDRLLRERQLPVDEAVRSWETWHGRTPMPTPPAWPSPPS
jgi:eukaryotic-like serine/threonine-protein kinase